LKFESKEVEDYICKTKYPDFRGIYKFIQSAYKTHGSTKVITMEMVANTIFEFADLYKMILDAGTTADNFHEYLMTNYSDKTDDVILSLDANFVNYVRDTAPHLMNALPEFIIENARHQHMFVTALDQTTVMKSLCFILNSIVKKYTQQKK
jgi:phosphoribosylpyrophosphate synthetase